MRSSLRTFLGLPGACILLLPLVGCAGSPDGKYCDCAESGRPKLCVTIEQKDDTIDIEFEVDDSAYGSENVSYKSESGYGHAEADLGPLTITLGPPVIGNATAVSFDPGNGGPFQNRQMTREYSCK